MSPQKIAPRIPAEPVLHTFSSVIAEDLCAADILVSGTGSGLGKYLKEAFNADAYNRNTSSAPRHHYDAIIHCAFNIAGNVEAQYFPLYVEDTIGLTERLLQIPHRQFIYISSAAVYPADGKVYSEESQYNAGALGDLYSFMKLTCENLVRRESKIPLILRPTYMLGPYSYRNCLIDILTEQTPEIAIPETSEFNYILHEDVKNFIREARLYGLRGTYNLSASSNITIGEVARYFKKTAFFGNYPHKSSRVHNEKAIAVSSTFKRTSLENVQRFYNTYLSCKPLDLI